MNRMAVHYDARLVEEAVFYTRPDHYVRRELNEQRDRIYEVSDRDEREREFSALYSAWFHRLGLGKVIEDALREQPLLTAEAVECFVLRATLAKEEGAELFVAKAGTKQLRTLRILIRPETLVEAQSARTFLRHELFHIADMLDPDFAYEPALPKTDGGPTYDNLIINRYRVLWDVTINGRMVRRGWLPEAIRDGQLDGFRRTFLMLEEKASRCFQRFFDTDHPSHSALAAFALDPRAVAGEVPKAAGTHCALCKFPTHSFEPEPENLPEHVLAAIRSDFPQWLPAHGLCLQCADLYRSRQLSTAAALTFPGTHHADSDRGGGLPGL